MWEKRDYDKLRLRGRKSVERRKRWLRENPLCVHCQAQGRVRAATELDHIVPLFKGGAEDPTNLAGLCHDCHLEKSLAEKGHTQRPTIGVDGFPVNS